MVAKVRTMTAAIALNRFGLGARADDLAPAQPRAWLLSQFEHYDEAPASWRALPTTATIARDYVQDRMAMRGAEDSAKKQAQQVVRKDNRNLYLDAVNARAASTLTSPAPFVERLVHFWANHFAVSADKSVVIPYVGAFEAEAIRPHVLGRFEDLLIAVEQHAAMQLYLDQVRSAGPDSPLAQRAAARDPDKKLGLNENLAREILELHTYGVRTGYSQADVTEFARALTGWSIGAFGRGAANDPAEPGSFRFRPELHEPGVRTIMGKRYDQLGEIQAVAILRDLAVAPATARHIATKLARHFVADDPLPALIDQLTRNFQASGGDLPTIYRALVEAPESWATTPAKFKTPWEWLVSSMRGIGMRELGDINVAQVMQQLGQPVWRPGSPAGYDDIAASWAAPDALLRRVEVAQRIASRVDDRLDPRALAPTLLPGALGQATQSAIAGAESQPTGLALLLVSPEFQRR